MPRPHFTLRGLLVFFFGSAVGLAALPKTNRVWNQLYFAADALFAAAIALFVVGLVVQAFDLVSGFRRSQDISADERFGWQFAIAWRLAIAVVLAALMILQILVTRNAISLPRPTASHDPFPESYEGLLYLSLLVVVASVRSRRLAPAPSFAERVLSFSGLVAGTILGLVILVDRTWIAWLTYITVRGIETARPFEYSHPETGPFGGLDSNLFVYWSALASVLVAANLSFAYCLARQWDRGVRRRLAWIALLLTGVAGTALYACWVYTRGLAALSPAMSDGFRFGHAPQTWMFTGCLTIEVATIVAYQFVICRRPVGRDPNEISIPQREPYWHERRWVLLLIPASVIVDVLSDLSFELGKARRFHLLNFAGEYLERLVWLLLAAVATLAVRQAWHGFAGAAIPRSPSTLRAGCFGAVWLAVLATLLTAIPALAGLSFAVWLTPWYR